MRKLLPALCCLLFMTGVLFAGEVTLVKFDKDKKELTVKEGAAQKTYKVTDRTKFLAVDKKSGESKALPYEKALLGLLNPNAEGSMKFTITSKNGEVLEARLPGRKKK